jgi:hypothetical protein
MESWNNPIVEKGKCSSTFIGTLFSFVGFRVLNGRAIRKAGQEVMQERSVFPEQLHSLDYQYVVRSESDDVCVEYVTSVVKKITRLFVPSEYSLSSIDNAAFHLSR